MAKIFVSYRRQDSSVVAAVLKERIERRFGKDSAFLDVDNIPVGADFRKHIESAVGQCHAMLVLIGEKWLAQTEGNRNRLFEPRDYVRIEIEIALRRDIPLVPVLVEGVTMPGPDDLPGAIQAFTFRNATEIRGGHDFEHHVTRLVDGLWRELEPEPTVRPPRPSMRKAKPGTEPAPRTKYVAKKAHGKASRPSIAAERRLNLTAVRHAFDRDFIFTYVGSAIPEKKLRNALDSYAQGARANDVLLLYDNTFFGGARDGFLVTKTAIYWRNPGEPADSMEFRDLKSVKRSYDRGPIKLNDRVIHITALDCAAALVRLLKGAIET